VLQQESIKAQCVSRVHRLSSVIKHGLGLKGVCASGGSGDKTNSFPSLAPIPSSCAPSQREESLVNGLTSRCSIGMVMYAIK